jgi:hypothetical protein
MYRNRARLRLLLTLCVVVPALSLVPVAGAGVLVAVDAVNGVETGFQQGAGGPGTDLSQFAGLLTGQLPGVFTTDVLHSPNPTVVGGSAAVTGGTIGVSNPFAGTALTGSITSGIVTLVSEDPGCGRQRFRIGVQIANLRGTAKGSAVTGGVGAASVVLTHYRAFVFTAAGFRCTTLAGTIAGTPPDAGVTFTLTTV